MNNFFYVIVITFINLYNYNAFSTDEHSIKSPLRVAQCRATCLERFFNDGPQHGESMCLQGPDCFMCWENCELLQSNFTLWGSVCEEKEICFPGCQEACRFHAETEKQVQSQPVIHTRDQGVITISGPLAEWPRPRNLDEKKPLIYIVMQRTQTGPWRQIIQTLDLTTRVPVSQNNLDAMSTLRILAVDSSGLVTIYSPDEKSLLPETKKKRKQNSDMDIDIINTPMKWHLHKVSLIHQKVLVIGEIAWSPLVKKGVYLVTWEVHGGGLKGNLFTDSTHVTLSLWPDTVYHIQVELMTRTSKVLNTKSQIMDLDTGTAQKILYTSPSTKNPLLNNLRSQDIIHDDDILSSEKNSAIFSVLVSETNHEYFSSNEYHFILALKFIGLVSMVLCCCFFVYFLALRYCWCSNLDEIPSEKLIEEEDYYKDIQPILTENKFYYHLPAITTTTNTTPNFVRNQNFAHFGLNLLYPTTVKNNNNNKNSNSDSPIAILIKNDQLSDEDLITTTAAITSSPQHIVQV